MNSISNPSPAWFEEYLTSFLASEAHGFLIYGDITGTAYAALSHRGFLVSQLASRRQVVLMFDRARGITFADPAMKEKALAFLGREREEEATPTRADPFEAALAGIGNITEGEPADPFSIRKPLDALMLIEKLMRSPAGKQQVAVIIDYADSLCPPTDKAIMPADNLTILVLLQSWARDAGLARCNNPFFLLTKNLADLHQDLRVGASGFKAIEIALPGYRDRLTYVAWYLSQRGERGKPIALVDLEEEELARLTAGLNLRHIEDILLLGARTGVTRLLVKGRKDAIITTENSEVAEMLEPLPGGFASLGGMERLIAWARTEVIDPIRTGKAEAAPKGVLLVGPPGSGKTYYVKALAYEIGFNAVSLNLENILGSLVGESEKKLKQFFTFARALAPVLIFLDELDQSDVSRRGNTSGNPVASNLFSAMLRFMSDETLRGKVIFFFASNRPDLIDPALMRFGRIDAVIPVLLPDETARAGIAQAQAKQQQTDITMQATELIAKEAVKYSASDIAAVIAKARKLSGRRNLDYIDQEAAEQALRLIKPATPRVADWYTLLAVRACNDAELLPPEEATLMDDPQTLQARIRETKPQDAAMREERSW